MQEESECNELRKEASNDVYGTECTMITYHNSRLFDDRKKRHKRYVFVYEK